MKCRLLPPPPPTPPPDSDRFTAPQLATSSWRVWRVTMARRGVRPNLHRPDLHDARLPQAPWRCASRNTEFPVHFKGSSVGGSRGWQRNGHRQPPLPGSARVSSPTSPTSLSSPSSSSSAAAAAATAAVVAESEVPAESLVPRDPQRVPQTCFPSSTNIRILDDKKRGVVVRGLKEVVVSPPKSSPS